MSSDEFRNARIAYDAELEKRGEPKVKIEHFAAVLDRYNVVHMEYFRELMHDELYSPYKSRPVDIGYGIEI
jgi:alanyl-tRNA synthetase